jgi:hypothetical protein
MWIIPVDDDDDDDDDDRRRNLDDRNSRLIVRECVPAPAQRNSATDT